MKKRPSDTLKRPQDPMQLAHVIGNIVTDSPAVWVKCSSHRARDKMLRALTDENKCSYYSLHRDTGKGTYHLTYDEYALVKDITGISKLRGPFDDLMKCWSP